MRTAAEKYSLATLSEAIEDEEASTVCFLLGPLSANSPVEEKKQGAPCIQAETYYRRACPDPDTFRRRENQSGRDPFALQERRRTRLCH